MPQEARAVLRLIVASAVVRLIAAAPLGLSVDESYTVAISRRFAWSYFDHPPLHVWLAGAWARLMGSEQPLLLRLPNLLMFAASTWLMYRLTAAMFGERAGMWAALAFNLAPLFTLAAAVGIVPDGPLVLFSLLAVHGFALAASRALTGASPGAVARADGRLIGAGAAAGLALVSKYTALSLPFSLGLFVAVARRRLCKSAALWLALALALLIFFPVIAWNEEHSWVSFAFQGGRARPVSLNLGRALWSALGELLYLLPWLALALIAVLVRALSRGPRDPSTWLFACLAVLPIAGFALVSLWAPVLPHWAALGWLFAFPLLGRELAMREPRKTRDLRHRARATAAVLLFLVAAFVAQTATGWMEAVAPGFLSHDPTVDFLDWRALRARAAGIAGKSFIATVSWIDAGKSDYALGGTIPVLCLSADARQFGFMYDRRMFRSRDALIIADANRRDWLRLAAVHFRHVEPGADVLITRAGRAAVILHTAYGYDFSGM